MVKRFQGHVILLLGLLLCGQSVASGYAIRTVQRGESLGTIANRYNISVSALQSFNDLETTLIYPGDVLKIPYASATGGALETAPTPPAGFRLHQLAAGETISSLMTMYDLSLEAIVGANPDVSSLDRLPVGLELLIPPAKGLVITLNEGETVLDVLDAYEVEPLEFLKANAIDSPADLVEGQMLFLPGIRPLEALDRLAKVREAENRYLWPVHGRITSYYGRRNLGMGTSNFHSAIDIAAPYGTPITAARSGTVTYAGWSNRGYGYLIKIRHAGGDETWYAHESKVLVSVGQYVSQGEIIGRIGSTGLSTGPHLHFEVRERGRPVNPLIVLN